MTLELRHLSAELHVTLTAHVIVTPSGRHASLRAAPFSYRGGRPALLSTLHDKRGQ
ncbi:hypothetical protein ACSRUE_11145 [Sorangium sp. KYC3313]|uniref:hypothetical protein n=1 Tax=Sorangium sp. KYC3313 TaxID=3449740 RepID=UPI003F89B386